MTKAHPQERGFIYKTHVFLLAIVVVLVSVGVLRRNTSLLSTPEAHAEDWDVEIGIFGQEVDIVHNYHEDTSESPPYDDSMTVYVAYTKPLTGWATLFLFVDGKYKGMKEDLSNDTSGGETFEVNIPQADHDFESYNVQVKLYDGRYQDHEYDGVPSENMELEDTDSVTATHHPDHYNIHLYGGYWSPQIHHNEEPTPAEDRLHGAYRVWLEDDGTFKVKIYVGNVLVATSATSIQGPGANYQTVLRSLTNLTPPFEHQPNQVGNYEVKLELYDEDDVLRSTKTYTVPHDIGECNDRFDNDEDTDVDYPYDDLCVGWTDYTEGLQPSPSPSTSPLPSPDPSPSPSASVSPSPSPSASPGASPSPGMYCVYDEYGNIIYCT